MNAILPTSTTSKRNYSANIDMTPMVDLGFLLITFFIFTSTMNEAKALKLIMPNENDRVPPAVKESHVATVILGQGNLVFYYEGFPENAFKNKNYQQTHFGKDGVREMIMEKKRHVGQDIIILIKTTPDCSYGNLVDAMDEMNITNVEKWMVLDASPEEQMKLGKH
jgi:biopolymer transport protein ExbD